MPLRDEDQPDLIQQSFEVNQDDNVDLNPIAITPLMNQECVTGMNNVTETRMMNQNVQAADRPVTNPALFYLGESSMSQLAMPVSIERVNEKQMMERENNNLDDEVISSSAIVAF